MTMHDGPGNPNFGKDGDAFLDKRSGPGRKLALTPEQFKEKADAYFAALSKNKKPPTVTGLFRALGISHTQYYEYRDREGYGDVWHDTRMRLGEAWEERLWTANATGAIFWLKNNFDYKDQRQQEISGPNGGPVQIAKVEIVGVLPPGANGGMMDPDAL